ncbi:unnamed protein product [Cylicocyclus nassatus]|uniref:Uncharacterized protein n=1 Tax=Cylicocyclus nassatus TaxID=53992 RepID=A0AA36HEG4_CYLNA|nr:unnamed protein product [Cylicocyclus nassatus]
MRDWGGLSPYEFFSLDQSLDNEVGDQSAELAHIYRTMFRITFVVFSVILFVSAAVVDRSKRQTYKYDESLLKYAHPHPGTKVQQGYLARYAPQEWPKWYSRVMMQWDGQSVLAPYEQQDVRYPGWHVSRIRGY